MLKISLRESHKTRGGSSPLREAIPVRVPIKITPSKSMCLSNPPLPLLAFPEQWDVEDLEIPASLSMALASKMRLGLLQKPGGDHRLHGDLGDWLVLQVFPREDSSSLCPCTSCYSVMKWGPL